jgi:hypothetical protein
MIEPVRIEPEAIYDDGSLYQFLGLSPTSLAAGRRAGTLRHTRHGKRVLYLGRWVLTWLESQAIPRSFAVGAGQVERTA